MTCENVRNRFSELLDGDLPESIEREVQEHLVSCSPCRAEWGRFQRTVSAVRNLPQHPASKGFAAGVMSRLERDQILTLPERGQGLKRWSSPGFLLKGLAAAAVLLLVVKIGTQGPSPSPQPTPSQLDFSAIPESGRESASKEALKSKGDGLDSFNCLETGNLEARRVLEDEKGEKKMAMKDEERVLTLDVTADKNKALSDSVDLPDRTQDGLLAESASRPPADDPVAPAPSPSGALPEPFLRPALETSLAWACTTKDPVRDTERIQEALAGLLPLSAPLSLGMDRSSIRQVQQEGAEDARNASRRGMAEASGNEKGEKEGERLRTEDLEKQRDASSVEENGPGEAKASLGYAGASASSRRILAFRIRKSDLGEAAQRLSELGARAVALKDAKITYRKRGEPKVDWEDAPRAKTPGTAGPERPVPADADEAVQKLQRQQEDREEDWVELTVTLEILPSELPAQPAAKPPAP